MSTGRPTVESIDHVQLAMPPGPEAEARAEAFFSGMLGLPRVAKSPQLAARGGCWFERGCGQDPPRRGRGLRPAGKAHPGLVVSHLDQLCEQLDGAGFTTRRTEDVPGHPQWYVDDPFGNRIELLPDR